MVSFLPVTRTFLRQQSHLSAALIFLQLDRCRRWALIHIPCGTSPLRRFFFDPIMPSRSSPVYDVESVSGQDIESGYVSGSGSEASIPELYFTKPHLNFLNRQLQNLEPQGISILRFLCSSHH